VLTDPPTSEVYPPYPGTWQEFCSWFADEQSCAAYLEQLRWPVGVRCPKCEQGKGWRTAEGRWACSGCGRKVSVTAGTIFDRSRISLQEWFAAAWYMTNQKHGVSALGLQRLLGLGSYQTACAASPRCAACAATAFCTCVWPTAQAVDRCIEQASASPPDRMTQNNSTTRVSPDCIASPDRQVSPVSVNGCANPVFSLSCASRLRHSPPEENH
jgi:transposase-like protein